MRHCARYQKMFQMRIPVLGRGSTIQYTEEQNDVYEASSSAEGMREDKALVRYRIDIWNNHSTSEISLRVDEAMKVTGLKRIACADVTDPSGMKHKQMRYEGIIDMDSDPIMVPVTVTCAGVDDENIEVTPKNIPIKIDERKSIDRIISTELIGESKPDNNYEVGKITANPEKINIVGPKSIIEK